MAGPYTQLLNVSASGPILYPDEIMDAGTLSVIDFLDPYTWPDEVAVTPVSTSDDYKQFDARVSSHEGPPVTFNYPLGVSGGAVAFDGVEGRNMILPPAWKLDAGMKHFGMAFWMQMAPTITSGFNNMLAGLFSSEGVIQWSLTPSGNGSNSVVQCEFYCRPGDTGYALSYVPGLSLVDDVFNSSRVLLGFDYQENDAGTHFDQRFYLNGLLRGVRPGVPTAREFIAASSGGNAIVGAPAAYVGGTFIGNFCRAWLQDFTKSNRTMEEMIAQDWAVNRQRMGA